MNSNADARIPFQRCGALLGGLAVLAGAFGAHGLKQHLSAEMLQIFETACRYQFFHAVVLWTFGFFPADRWNSQSAKAGVCLVAGILIFSGSLYALALSGLRILGAVTPLGGTLLMLGWGFLFFGITTEKTRS